MSDFRFDPASFLIGFGSASALSFVTYRMRHRLTRLRSSAEARAESARRYATRTADVRYQIDLRNYCQRYHIAPDLVRLTDTLIEPRFIPGNKPYDTTGESRLHDVFHVVPIIHQMPALHAPYHIKTIGIEDLGAGSRHIALLGLPGSGRSTALAAIALWALGAAEFDQPQDIVQHAIEQEEAGLTEKERNARRKQLADIQARALEQIARAQEEASASLRSAGDEQPRDMIDLRRLMPILVHFSDIVVAPEGEKGVDPAEPLVQAIRFHLRPVTALSVPRYVYNRLNSGQALVLLDGLDDLTDAEQALRLAWLRRFLASYPECTVIVAGPASGYYPLQELGLAPMFLRPWANADTKRYATRWAERWPEATGSRRKPGTAPDERTVGIVASQICNLTPLDITARILSAFARNEEEVENLTRWDWYSDLVTRRVNLQALAGSAELADDVLFAIAKLAALMLERGTLSGEELHQQAETVLRHENGAGEKGRQETILPVDRFIQLLTAGHGLLVQRLGNRYEFSHPLIRAFLASATLLNPGSEHTLQNAAAQPEWQPALPFAVTHAPEQALNQIVVNKLSAQPDILFRSLMELASWMPWTPGDSPWRGEVLKRLTAALIAPTQFPALRSRAAAALVTARDPNVLYILRQAARSTTAEIRALGCIGLGALGDSEAIRDLRPMLVDENLEVQLAAAMALGAIGSEIAIESMLEGLYNGDENLRQAVAEALAALPDPGHKILHQAVTHQDMMVRRAAVFGLARIGTPWALTDLYHQLLEDDQWYVRSAVEQVFAAARPETRETVTAHPPVEELAWVAEWLAERKLTLADGQDARQALLRILQGGDPVYRVASARTLGILGYLPAVNALYHTLADEHEAVRSASYAALADIQNLAGTPLPGII